MIKFTLRFLSQRKYQKSLRHYLKINKPHKCIMCNYNFPLEVLETSHLKPNNILDKLELSDYNNVEFMCRNCHKYYDLGYISIVNGMVIKNKKIADYDYTISNKYIDNYNYLNAKYYNYHYKNIFIKN